MFAAALSPRIERLVLLAADYLVERWNVRWWLRGKRKIRNAALRDPNSTPEHKAEMQAIYQRYCEAAMHLGYKQLRDLNLRP